MTATIIDGKAIAQEIRAEVRQSVVKLRAVGVEPGLAVVLVGDDPGSISYVRGKTEGASELGMRSETIRLDASTSQEALLGLIATLVTFTLGLFYFRRVEDKFADVV